jgi:hypothetical protein
MPNIPIQQARQLLTQSFLGAWKESFPVTNFMRSWFENKTSKTQFVSIEVQRGTKKIAVDVLRGVEGNKNKFGLSTQKIFLPPYYSENFNNTSLALYDQLASYAGEVVDTELLAEAVREITDNYLEMKLKIERAYEVQAAQVLQTGKVTTKTLELIDYKAKSTHIKTLSTLWSVGTPKIFESLRDICGQLKKDGAAATEFDIVLGALALQCLLDSDEYKDKYGLYPMVPGQYNLPRAEQTSGAVFHNRIAAGPYILNLWSYGETYTNESGVDTPYLDEKKVIVIAKSFKGFMAFGAVPRVLTDNGILQNQQFASVLDSGAYVLNNYIKPEVSSHVFEIKSAGLVVPLAIDHFACLTVLS